MTPREAFLGAQEIVPAPAGRRPHRRRVARDLPAGDPQRAARRAPDGGDARLHPAHARARRQRARRERPAAAHGARRGGARLSGEEYASRASVTELPGRASRADHRPFAPSPHASLLVAALAAAAFARHLAAPRAASTRPPPRSSRRRSSRRGR